MNRVEEHLTTADIAGAGGARERAPEPLLPNDFVQELRGRWDQVQAGFVDEPRGSVQRADELVALAIKRLADSFSNERIKLEEQWARGENVNTEDLRIALQKYRTFFQRLLTV